MSIIISSRENTVTELTTCIPWYNAELARNPIWRSAMWHLSSDGLVPCPPRYGVELLVFLSGCGTLSR